MADNSYDFSAIQDDQLREALAKSKKFAALSPGEKAQKLIEIASLPAAQQAELIKFFLDENAQEQAQEDANVQILNNFVADLKEFESKFTRMANQEHEAGYEHREKAAEDQLINKLNNL